MRFGKAVIPCRLSPDNLSHFTHRKNMIVIGTMNWSSTRSRGMFLCPSCGSREVFRFKSSRPFLTLYFIPVLPIGGIEEFVQCGRCKNAFDPAVLANRVVPSPAAGPTTGLAESKPDSFHRDLLTIIALIMIEDGQVTEQEIAVARKLYQNIAQSNITREELGRTCSQVRLKRLHLPSFLNSVVERRTHQEKLLLVQAMFGVSGADGEISPGRMQALMQSQSALRIDESEFQRAISDTTQWLN
jgi:predicted RNA-binding Zn-ribbon protein involved in translation (DUF1610 family)/uncharacterized tellurite resistance protein B-like protein